MLEIVEVNKESAIVRVCIVRDVVTKHGTTGDVAKRSVDISTVTRKVRVYLYEEIAITIESGTMGNSSAIVYNRDRDERN